MAIEIKQHLKLQQQLVMTPQLQQAIKLLQLSRMELADTIRDEILENPILEDAVDTASEEPKTAEAADGADVEHVGETETPVVEIREDKIDTTAEVKADSNSNDAVNDFDWEGYLDNQAAAAPMPSYKSNNEDLPSLESTLTRGTSLFDHLEWQLKLSPFSREEDGIGMLIIGNLTPDGYLEEPLGDLAEEASVSLERGRVGAEADPGVRSDWRRRPLAGGVPADPGAPHRRRRRGGGRDHREAPLQPGEEELPGDRQGPGPAGRRDLRGGQGGQGLRPQAGAAVHLRGADLHHPGRLRAQDWRQVLRGRQRRRPPQAEDLRLLPDGAGGGTEGARVHSGEAAQRPVADPVPFSSGSGPSAASPSRSSSSSASSSTRGPRTSSRSSCATWPRTSGCTSRRSRG